jgi:hypothetical protein
MCPDKKLKWFKDHGRTAAQIRDIRKLVVTRWNETYKGDEGPVAAAVRQRDKVSLEHFVTARLRNYFVLAQIEVGS